MFARRRIRAASRKRFVCRFTFWCVDSFTPFHVSCWLSVPSTVNMRQSRAVSFRRFSRLFVVFFMPRYSCNCCNYVLVFSVMRILMFFAATKLRRHSDPEPDEIITYEELSTSPLVFCCLQATVGEHSHAPTPQTDVCLDICCAFVQAGVSARSTAPSQAVSVPRDAPRPGKPVVPPVHVPATRHPFLPHVFRW